MKKEYKLLLAVSAIVLIIAVLLLIKGVHAQDEPAPDVLGIKLTEENIEKIPQTPEEAANVTKNYLKQEWGKDLRNENTILGKIFSPILKGYDKISPYTDPIFKYTLGMEPQLSWLFILTFTLWIALVTNLYRIFSVFSTFSKTASVMMSICMVVIISLLGLPKWIAGRIIAAISILGIWWVQLLVALAVLAILILASMFSEEFEKIMKVWKEKREKMKMINEIAELKEQGKSTEALEKALAEIGRA